LHALIREPQPGCGTLDPVRLRKGSRLHPDPRSRVAKGAIVPAIFLIAIVLAPGDAHAGLSAVERERVDRSGIVEASVVDALDDQDAVRVLIVFSAPDSSLEAGSRARRGRLPRPRDLQDLAARGQAIVEGLSAGDFRLRRRYAAIPALAGFISSRGLLELLDNPDVERVGIDRRVTVQLAEAVPLVNLDWLHTEGWTGQGIQVAVIDTGVDANHADLSDSVIAEQCFCRGADGPVGCCPDGSDTQSGTGAANDDHGHGTRVAGIVTSNGSVAPVGGAPAAEIVAVKVLNSSGGGYVSDVIAGLDWIILNRSDVDIINMSLGGGLYSGDCDTADATTVLYATAIDTLWQNGVLTVAGTGNNGSGTAMIAPACIAKALSVGAVWDADVGSQTVLGCTDATTQADQVTCFSNSSTTTDIFAPGALMTSTKAGGGSVTRSGTSYATPMVTACAAVLLGIRPPARPAELEAAMENSPTLVTDATNSLSFPRVDCKAAAASLPVLVPALTAWGLPIFAVFLIGASLWILGRRFAANPRSASGGSLRRLFRADASPRRKAQSRHTKR
jgi:subtilisin family serine protease